MSLRGFVFAAYDPPGLVDSQKVKMRSYFSLNNVGWLPFDFAPAVGKKMNETLLISTPCRRDAGGLFLTEWHSINITE